MESDRVILLAMECYLLDQSIGFLADGSYIALRFGENGREHHIAENTLIDVLQDRHPELN